MLKYRGYVSSARRNVTAPLLFASLYSFTAASQSSAQTIRTLSSPPAVSMTYSKTMLVIGI